MQCDRVQTRNLSIPTMVSSLTLGPWALNQNSVGRTSRPNPEWQNPFCSELDRCPAGLSTFRYYLGNINATLLLQDFDVIQETTVSYKFFEKN